MIADRLLHARPSATKAATARALELRAQGRDIIALSQGEPDFDTPENIRQAGLRAIRDGKTRYTPVAGIVELREAICEKFRSDNGLVYSPSDIIVGCGAKQVIFNALFATLNPGDEVIIPAPCWVSYPEMVRLAGGVPRIVDCTKENFKLGAEALAAAIGPRTRWVILNSPQNPTGAVYAEHELLQLAEILRLHPNIWVLSDDIYEKLVFAPAAFATIAAVAADLAARTLVVNGVSKSSCMTGWRVGYGAGPARLIAAMTVIQGQTTSHTCSISQYAAVEALSGPQGHVDRAREAFRRRRDLMIAGLARAQGLTCAVPDGAFYLFADCTRLIGSRAPDGRFIGDDEAFASYLLYAAGVAVVSGASFLASPFIRISCASSDAELERAADRIVEACGALR